MPLSPARKATLFALPAALIAGGITAFVISQNLSSVDAPQTGPLETVSVTEVDGTEDMCANVVIGLPEQIEDRAKRAVTGHPGALAWGDPPIVMVCGVEKPEALQPTSQLTAINSVTWIVEEAVDTTAYGLPGTNNLWTVVDRDVYIAVAVPNNVAGSVALAPISKTIGERLPSTEESPVPPVPPTGPPPAPATSAAPPS